MKSVRNRIFAIDIELENLYIDTLDEDIKLQEQDKSQLENIINVAKKILQIEKKGTKTMHEYFVTYELMDELGYSVNGRIYVKLPKKIDSAEYITKLEKYILDQCANPMIKSVCITNFILLKEYEVEIEYEEA